MVHYHDLQWRKYLYQGSGVVGERSQDIVTIKGANRRS